MEMLENSEIKSDAGQSLTIAHVSDLHIFSNADFSLTQLLNKRIYGYLSWRWRRGREHFPRILTALADDLCSFAPEQIAVTGDITHLGRPAEYLRAFSWLENLGSPARVMLIPGNHDAYVAGAFSASADLWQPYLFDDEIVAGMNSGSGIMFPRFRRCRDVVICGLNTAAPRPWWLATGAVGVHQLEILEQQLEVYGQQGLFRVVLLHHPPVPGLMSWRKRLEDEDAFCAVIKRQGAELILHGHTHRATINSLPAGSSRVPVFGVPAASAGGRTPDRRARYNLYRLHRVGNCWQISYLIRRYSFSQAKFITEIDWQQI
jgi:3',5'-cyclic AMP phosphodiesterase CpdA